MALGRPVVARGQISTQKIDPIWLAAGVGMLVLAACTYFLVPEQSFAIAAGLLILMIAAADLRIGFLSFVVIYPFLSITWGIDMGDWLPYLTALRICCLALALAFVPHWKYAFDTPRIRRVAAIILGLVVLQLLVGFASNDAVSSIKQAFGFVVEVYLPFLMAAHLFRTREQIRMLFTIACLAMAGACILGIIEHTIDYNFYDSFISTRDEINVYLREKTQTTRGLEETVRRIRVAFEHSIVLGMHIMVALLACVYLLRRKAPLSRLLLLAGVPIYCLAMVFTYSRGPMLGLVCGLIWLGLIGKGTRPMLLALVLSGLVSYQFLPTRARGIMDETISTTVDFDSGISTGGGSARARLFLLQTGLQYSRQNLWLGHGPGQVRQTKMRADSGSMVNFASVDNYYLSVLLNYGLIVLSITVGFFAYLLRTFTRAALRATDRDMAALLAVAAAMCVANYVAMVTVAFDIPLFWMLIGPALRAADLQPSESRGRRPRRGVPWRRFLTTDRWGNQPMGNWSHRGSQEPRVPTGVESAGAASSRVGGRNHERAGVRRACGPVTALAIVVPLAAGAVPCAAAPSFYGTTGLFASPVAAVPGRGTWSLGSNYVSRDFRPGASSISKGTIANYFAVTMLPRVELTLVLTNYEGKLGARNLTTGLTPDFNLGGYTLDRTVSTQWLAVTQQGARPAIAFGMRDIFGRAVKHLRAQYGVMSFARGRVSLSAGLGTQALHGPFGGVEYAIIPQVSAIVEGLHGQSNGGFRLMPIRNVQMDLAMMGFRSLGGGLSYRRRF
jgi:hypothetical protein